MVEPPQAALPACELWVWRHPKPIGATGRCIGRTDLPVDPRRVKRLAHRIQATARREQLPREIWTSPLARCAAVGRCLARWGFIHHIDARLAELDFGHWDGRPWSTIDACEVAQWEADFAQHRPGGGESLASLLRRTREFLAERAANASSRGALLVVGHAGWMQAVDLVDQVLPQAADWPRAANYAASLRRRWPVGNAA